MPKLNKKKVNRVVGSQVTEKKQTNIIQTVT